MLMMSTSELCHRPVKKSQVEISRQRGVQKGRTEQSRFAPQKETADSQCFMARSGGVLQRLRIDFHSSVIDVQELVGGGHHADAVWLARGAFPVHELADRFIQWRVLQIDAYNKE